MPYRINHIHLKARDPRQTAEWYVQAFGFKIVGDEVRAFGDRFLRAPDDARVELAEPRRAGIAGGCC